MSVTALRLDDALRTALGPDIANLLSDDALTDLLINADGRIWVDQLGTGRVDTGHTMRPADVEAALCLLANHCGTTLTEQSPILSATMPGTGERVAGTIPPVTAAPTVAIRKPPRSVFGLDAFSAPYSPHTASVQHAYTQHDNNMMVRLLTAVDEKRNILVAGSTGSGKTSMLSSLLQLPSVASNRMVVIEDTQEIVIGSPDHVRLLTTAEVDMKTLVELSLRYRPDRIVLGEVRSGPAALEMITAMNTGHPGSFATIHANSAKHAVTRLQNLCARVCNQTPTEEIAEAIGCVVFMVKSPSGRCIKEVVLT